MANSRTILAELCSTVQFSRRGTAHTKGPDTHGSQFHRRRAGIPARGTRFSSRKTTRRTQQQGAGRQTHGEGRFRSLAENPARAGMGCHRLAQGVRRRRLERRAEEHIRRRMRRRRRADAAALRSRDGGAGDHGLRQSGAEAALSAAHHRRHRLVVPGLFRAGFRLRSGLAENARCQGGRPLRRERPEDLEHPRPACRLDFLPGPHQH